MSLSCTLIMPKSMAIFTPISELASVMSTVMAVSLSWTGGFSLEVIVQFLRPTFWLPTYISFEAGVMSLVKVRPDMAMLTMSLSSDSPASTRLSAFSATVPCLLPVA